MKKNILRWILVIFIVAPHLLFAQQQTARDKADDIFRQLMKQDDSSQQDNQNPLKATQTSTKTTSASQTNNINLNQPANRKPETTTVDKQQDAVTPKQLQEMLAASIQQEVKIPDETQRQLSDKAMSRQLKEVLGAILHERLVDVAVETRYIVQLIPVIKQGNKLKKVKLPGFENYVWTPEFKDHNFSFSYQTKAYRSYFIFVNGPKTLVNYSLVQNKIKEMKPSTDWENRDILRVVSISSPILQNTTIQTNPEGSGETSQKKEKILEPRSLKEQMEYERQFSKYLLNARTEFLKGNLDTTLDNLIEAIKFNPQSAQAYEMLGSVYYRLRWKEKALHYWEKSLELYPNNPNLRKYYENLKRSS